MRIGTFSTFVKYAREHAGMTVTESRVALARDDEQAMAALRSAAYDLANNDDETASVGADSADSADDADEATRRRRADELLNQHRVAVIRLIADAKREHPTGPHARAGQAESDSLANVVVGNLQHAQPS